MSQDEIHVVVPGEPVAQGRPRAFRMKGTGAIRMYDPAKSRNWKAEARAFMLRAKDALGLVDLLDGPVSCHVRAVFSCPRSEYRKTQPRGMRLHAKRPDADQIAKAAMDAATGVIWTDDDRVAILRIEKVIGAQGEAPRVEITIRSLAKAEYGGVITAIEVLDSPTTKAIKILEAR